MPLTADSVLTNRAKKDILYSGGAAVPPDAGVLLVIGLGFILTSRIWLKNVYNRFMKRRYKNMEGFRDSRQ